MKDALCVRHQFMYLPMQVHSRRVDYLTIADSKLGLIHVNEQQITRSHLRKVPTCRVY
jgi:hypothetical protein